MSSVDKPSSSQPLLHEARAAAQAALSKVKGTPTKTEAKPDPLAWDKEGDWDKLDELLHADRSVCLLIASARDKMKLKPEDKGAYVKAFKAGLKTLSEEDQKAVNHYLDKAEKLGDIYAHKVAKKRTPKEPWEGEWDVGLSAYAGTGKFKGTSPPDSWAPSWWSKLGYIPGDRYCSAYAKAKTFNELMEVFWFAGTKTKPKERAGEVREAIAQAHGELNAW